MTPRTTVARPQPDGRWRRGHRLSPTRVASRATRAAARALCAISATRVRAAGRQRTSSGAMESASARAPSGGGVADLEVGVGGVDEVGRAMLGG
ncbi:hypothetical protein AB0A95_10040 [Micromonospora sp. NPDC049230]|uniref:hypothetical protein n=1 Tax=Micromonospora sp. NPDC049230 TaxID=3155502 RepID=UPI0033FB071A